MGREERFVFIFSHIALFVVFVWFGALKFFDASPANPLVEALLAQTLPFISFHAFILILGAVEVIIGLCFIIPGLTAVGLVLLIPHMITTVLPLLLLPDIAWHGAFWPTLEGQYMIKNLVIVALAANIFADRKKRYLKSLR